MSSKEERVRINSQPDEIFIEITGTFNFNDSLIAEAANSAIKKRITHLTFDLSHASYVSSLGIAAIVGTVKKMQAIGGQVRISGATDEIVSLVKTLRLDKYVTIIDTQAKKHAQKDESPRD